jgi:WD40 repeat protein
MYKWDAGVNAVGFSPDGRLLACGCDRTVFLWDVTDPGHPAQRVTVTHSDRSGAVKAVGFSVDGRLLAVGSGDVINPSGNMPVSRGAVALWDVTDLAHPVRTAIVRAGVQVHAVAFSPDGRLLASGNGGATVILWDVTDPAHLAAAATLTGHRGSVLGVAFSPDGRLLASCGADKTVRLWEVS